MIKYDADLKIFYSTLINDNRYFSGFATRELGDARNIEVIASFFQQQDVSFGKLYYLRQIHSTNIQVVGKNKSLQNIEVIDDTDGLITQEAQSVLIVRNADCVPVIFADKSKSLIGISHQGWRGTLKKLQIKMVETFTRFNSKLSDISVAIGPAIGQCCYEVDEDFYYLFLESFESYSKQIFQFKKGKWHMNLTLLNYLLLLEAGVKKENIDYFPFCTKCDKKRFFSRRRKGNDNYERMFNFIVRKY